MLAKFTKYANVHKMAQIFAPNRGRDRHVHPKALSSAQNFRECVFYTHLSPCPRNIQKSAQKCKFLHSKMRIFRIFRDKIKTPLKYRVLKMSKNRQISKTLYCKGVLKNLMFSWAPAYEKHLFQHFAENRIPLQ